jgi:hypothetical protein
MSMTGLRTRTAHERRNLRLSSVLRKANAGRRSARKALVISSRSLIANPGETRGGALASSRVDTRTR